MGGPEEVGISSLRVGMLFSFGREAAGCYENTLGGSYL
jgi:hypothetical protein